ncbi:MAG: hypothetical protein V4695_13200 [Pseudomonadota bacterium]
MKLLSALQSRVAVGYDQTADRSISSNKSPPATYTSPPSPTLKRVSRQTSRSNSRPPEGNTEIQGQSAHERKFALPSLGDVRLPCIGKSGCTTFDVSGVKRRTLQELIQSTEFQDLSIPGNRRNAVINIGHAITLAQANCPKFLPDLSKHIAGMVRDLLNDYRATELFESSADIDCKRYLHDENFQKFLEQACQKKEHFAEVAVEVFRKCDRRTVYREIFSTLQLAAGAFNGQRTQLTFLERSWNEASISRRRSKREAMTEFISFSIGSLPESPQRLKLALLIQRHLPKLSRDSGAIVARHLASVLQDVYSPAKALPMIPEDVEVEATLAAAPNLHPRL